MSDITLRAELIERGFGTAEIARLVRAGELTRLRRGAYVDPLPPDTAPAAAHRALVVATMRQVYGEAVVSHGSAAVMHGLPTLSDQLARVHVTRDRAGGGKIKHNLHLHGLPLENCDVVTIDGTRVTSLARTVLDLCVRRARLQYVVRDRHGHFVARGDFGWPELGTIGEFDGKSKYGPELLKPGQRRSARPYSPRSVGRSGCASSAGRWSAGRGPICRSGTSSSHDSRQPFVVVATSPPDRTTTLDPAGSLCPHPTTWTAASHPATWTASSHAATWAPLDRPARPARPIPPRPPTSRARSNFAPFRQPCTRCKGSKDAQREQSSEEAVDRGAREQGWGSPSSRQSVRVRKSSSPAINRSRESARRYS